MSHDRYKTIEGKFKKDRQNRMQRIHIYWAVKWFTYKMVHPRYAKQFAFTPPWGDCR